MYSKSKLSFCSVNNTYPFFIMNALHLENILLMGVVNGWDHLIAVRTVQSDHAIIMFALACTNGNSSMSAGSLMPQGDSLDFI